jgi:hypothetical protein
MLNDLKAEIGHAYLRAVAHTAGYFVQEANRTMDADGVDFTIFAPSAGRVVRSPRLDVQLKVTAEPVVEDPFPFDLPVKNHEELRSAELQVPRVLVVVVVPPDAKDWVSASEEQLVLRRCGYWLSLRGAAGTENTATVRVRIPRAACFHVDDVRNIMRRIEEGGDP